ncbi:MAG: transferrin-binding protein-like solute binding protein, partial [Boseongicola sp.]|nr:transferrin-binding protein-like solute binding protein [Boseongicola sp.]
AGRNVATLADQGTSGHAVIGIPTTDFSGNAGRATYTNLSGTDGALLELRPSQGYGGIDDRIDLYADLALVADFSNQTLSGRLFNFTDDDDDSWRLEMAMPETPFTNEGFSGYFEVSGLLSGSSAVTYEGSFYGPNAQEVGGTIEGTIIGTGGIRYITTGGFAGSQ